MPWVIEGYMPDGTPIRHFEGDPTPEEEAEFYEKVGGVKAVVRPIGRCSDDNSQK